MAQFHFDPDSYLELMAEEVPAYARLQSEVAAATEGLVGVDASAEMLAHAELPGAELRVARLEDPLPSGPFALVFSALAVHHLVAWSERDLAVLVATAP